jgi:hypothetical protein
MVRSIGYLVSLVPLCLFLPNPAAGQAAAEAGLGAARAATSTAPAAGIGKAMSGLAGSLDKAIKAGSGSAGSATGATTVTTVRMSPTPAKKTAAAAANWEDPNGIEAGLGYADLVRRFGPPAMEITSETGTSLTYAGKAGMFQLEVRDGKVASVEKPRS